MRDRETIDSELRRVAAELRSIRERGGQPSSQQLDALLDERLGHPVEVLSDTAVLDEILAPFEETFERPRRRRKSLPMRLALRAVVPTLAIAAVLVVMFVAHRHHRPSQPAPVSEEQPTTVAPPRPVAPVSHPSPADIAQKAMVDVLQREGVPVPNSDYATTQGHAVCDYLGRDADIANATAFVQRSTIWDAAQSADFTSAAIVTYCPQFESAGTDQVQHACQKSVTNLQAIEGDLQGINRDLQGIRDGLHGDG